MYILYFLLTPPTPPLIVNSILVAPIQSIYSYLLVPVKSVKRQAVTAIWIRQKPFLSAFTYSWILNDREIRLN